MKITKIEMEFKHKLYLGSYETIEPSVKLSADIDPGEDLETVRAALSQELQTLWAREVSEELRLVDRRRGLNGSRSQSDKVPELSASFEEILKVT